MKKAGILILIILIAAGVYYNLTRSKSEEIQIQPTNGKLQTISTKPDPLDKAIILQNQIIEVEFSHPLESTGLLKFKIEPQVEFNLELSEDKRTVKFNPKSSFILETNYKLTILPETQFVNGQKFGEEKSFSFSTIKYRGI